MVVKTEGREKVTEKENMTEVPDTALLKKMLLEEELFMEEITVDCICGVY